MRKLLVLICFTFVCIICSGNTYAQPIVVSEYFNVSGDPTTEWTELLVLQDNISISGYTLRDNSGSDGICNSWMGGVKFKNIPLWNNLRKGTVIVINHRSNFYSIVDKDKNDGYIEVAADDQTIFDRRLFNATDWMQTALNINQESDILELLDENDKHVHSLSHISNPAGTNYDDMIGPKANHRGTVDGGGSVRICPGLSVEAYSSGITPNNDSTASSTSNVTKGWANNSQKHMWQNQLFWRNLRQPDWTNPALTAAIQSSGILLSWNAQTDANPTDHCQGYIILRIPNDQINTAETPKDYYAYKNGDKIGSAVVIANIDNSLNTSYLDTSRFDCGTSNYYRIYAYRYAQTTLNDNNLPQDMSLTGVGRSYQETPGKFAETKVDKQGAQNVVLSASPNINKICEGESVKLSVNDYGNNYQYEWYLNNTKIQNAQTHTYTATQSGEYKVYVIFSASGCTSISNSFNLTVYPYPNAKIRVNSSNTLLKDTVVNVCKGENVVLKADGGETYDWYKNNNFEITSSSTRTIDANGVYFAIAKNGALCADTTPRVTVRFSDVNMYIMPSSLTFNLSSTQSSDTKELILTNNSSDTLYFVDLVCPAFCSIIDPQPPYFIAPNSAKVFKVRFLPASSGNFSGDISFIAPCSITKTITVNGTKDPALIQSSTTSVNFKNIISCQADKQAEKIQIKNTSTQNAYFDTPIISGPFTVDSPAFPLTLAIGQQQDISITFATSSVGLHTADLKLPYTIGSIHDTIIVALGGEEVMPEFTTSEKVINLTMNSSDTYIDTDVTIVNTGKVDITINSQPSDNAVKYINLPLIVPANSSAVLKVRCTPNGEGNFTYNPEIKENNCSISQNITINITKNSSNITLSTYSIDFGNISLCSSNISQKMNFEININNPSGNEKISEIKLPDNFTTNLTVGESLSASTNVEVNLIANAAKSVNDSLVLTFAPDGRKAVVKLSAYIYKPDFTVSVDTLNFGNVDINTNQSNYIEITNNSERPLVLSNVIGINSPFSVNLNADGIAFPYTLVPKAKIKFKVNVLMTQAGIAQNNFVLKFSEPCSLDSTITLIANCIDNRTMAAKLHMLSLTEEIGNNFEVPVTISNYDDTFANTTFKSFSSKLNIDETLVRPVDILIGKGLNTSKFASRNIQKIAHNTYLLTFDLTAEVKIADPELFVIKCKALFGDNIRTNLYLDSIGTTSTPKIIAESDTAIVIIQGDCDLNNRFIKETSPLAVQAVSTSNGNEINVNFTVSSNDLTNLELYDNYGNKIMNVMNKVIKPGQYSASINSTNLNNGLYFVRITNGVFTKSCKLLLIK